MWGGFGWLPHRQLGDRDSSAVNLSPYKISAGVWYV